jgi:hypothetical protein
MWAILLNLIRFGGTAAAGWAISDIFNEKKDPEQPEENKTFGSIIARNWFKWVLIAVVTTVMAVIALRLTKNKK